jgi:serine incorporator 1/3
LAHAGDLCAAVVGYQAVYRYILKFITAETLTNFSVCLGMAAFFGVFMLLMLGVRSSRDARSHIQNGFWFFKYLLLGLLIFGFFQIENENLATRESMQHALLIGYYQI